MAFLALMLAAAVGLGQAQVEPRPRLVIDAVVLDRSGVPITDLRRDEVEVWINRYRVPVDSFIAVTPAYQQQRPRSIVLLLDDVTVGLATIPRVKDAARRVIEQIGPDDRVAIVTLEGPVIESTNERVRLLQAVDRYTQRLTGVVTRDLLGERVLRALTSASAMLGADPNRRKTIVGIGSTWLLDTPIPPAGAGRDLRPEWTAAMQATAAANASFYVIEPSGVGATRTYGGSSGLAHETGGYAFANINDLKAAVDRILQEAESYYLIGVANPPVGRAADLRDLDVRILRRGVTVRARRTIPGGG